MNTRKYAEPQNKMQAIMPFLYGVWQIKHLDILKYGKNTRSSNKIFPMHMCNGLVQLKPVILILFYFQGQYFD